MAFHLGVIIGGAAVLFLLLAIVLAIGKAPGLRKHPLTMYVVAVILVWIISGCASIQAPEFPVSAYLMTLAAIWSYRRDAKKPRRWVVSAGRRRNHALAGAWIFGLAPLLARYSGSPDHSRDDMDICRVRSIALDIRLAVSVDPRGVHQGSFTTPSRPMDDQGSAVPQITVEELVAFLDLTIDCAIKACSALRYNFYDPRDRFSVLLVYAVIDDARAVLALVRAGALAGTPIVTRSALDAYADIANLSDHPEYWQSLQVADAEKWKKLLERASQGENPVLKQITLSASLPIGRKQNARELDQLRLEGGKSLGIGERFKKAGLTDEYESVYAILSSEAHNNVSYLQSRYIDYDDQSAWITTPVETSRHAQRDGRSTLLTMGEIVLRSAEKVLRLFGHGIAVLSTAERELQRIWQFAHAEESQPP